MSPWIAIEKVVVDKKGEFKLVYLQELDSLLEPMEHEDILFSYDGEQSNCPLNDERTIVYVVGFIALQILNQLSSQQLRWMMDYSDKEAGQLAEELVELIQDRELLVIVKSMVQKNPQ